MSSCWLRLLGDREDEELVSDLTLDFGHLDLELVVAVVVVIIVVIITVIIVLERERAQRQGDVARD